MTKNRRKEAVSNFSPEFPNANRGVLKENVITCSKGLCVKHNKIKHKRNIILTFDLFAILKIIKGRLDCLVLDFVHLREQNWK